MDRRTEKRISKFGCLAFIICALLLAFAFFGGFGFLGKWLEKRAFEVTLDLSVNGERIQITRRIRCQNTAGPMESIFNWRIRWSVSANSFGARLPSGGAIMAESPQLCWLGYGSDRSSTGDLPISKDFVPVIGWVDDADKPSVAEFYALKRYYDGPSARVRYHGIKARRIDSNFPKSGPVDEFDWFSSPNPHNFRFGFYAVRFARSDWTKSDVLARYIRAQKRLSLLPPDLAKTLAHKSRVPVDQIVRTHHTDRIPTFYPLFRSSQGWEIRPAERDYYVVYSSVTPGENYIDADSITFVSGTEEIRVPFPVRDPVAIFDPTTDVVICIHAKGRRFGPERN